jgi:DNA-binding NtrC family response regulator
MVNELTLMGFDVVGARDGEEALDRVSERDFQIALLDIKLPGLDGMEVLRAIHERIPSIEIIMLTGHGTVDNAVEAMKMGAFDFLTKPCSLENLEVVIAKALEKRRLVQENLALKQEMARRDRVNGFVGESSEMRTVLKLIQKVADTDSTVLIQGERGAGKELVASSIHKQSARKTNPFVIIDCGSLQENLLESELFGHEKGAYTGAFSLKHGLFEVADSGTIFFDEIGEISPSLQVKLLRVLETGSFRRVGGVKSISVDVRVVAATNQDLQDMVRAGKFREDLFYRLNIVTISIPPLRKRTGDISILARHFAENHSVAGKGFKTITPKAMELLEAYRWPGNVRELQNTIERAVILTEDESIKPEDLPSGLRSQVRNAVFDQAGPPQSLAQVEQRYIHSILGEVNGHRAKAARILKISERTLYRKLKMA